MFHCRFQWSSQLQEISCSWWNIYYQATMKNVVGDDRYNSIEYPSHGTCTIQRKLLKCYHIFLKKQYLNIGLWLILCRTLVYICIELLPFNLPQYHDSYDYKLSISFKPRLTKVCSNLSRKYRHIHVKHLIVFTLTEQRVLNESNLHRRAIIKFIWGIELYSYNLK